MRAVTFTVTLSDLAREWLWAVADLLAVIDGADEALLEDAIREAARRVREVMAGGEL